MSSSQVSQFDSPALLIACNNHNAENPLWHPQQQCLYWSDIPEGKLFRYLPDKKKHECVHQGEPIGGFTIQADGALLLFRNRGAVEIWQAGQTRTVIDEIPEAKETRFNDVVADPKGRVFAGTMAIDGKKGNLYRIDLDGSYRIVVKDRTIPNGMGFSLDYRFFYMTDSYEQSIYKFDYDVESGDISNRQLYIKAPEDSGVPDGMTIDSEGYLWSARWDGSAVYRYNHNGKEAVKLEIPALKASSLTFGGKDYSQLFISSARTDSPDQPAGAGEGDMGGNIFHLRSSVKGRPEMLSRVLL